MRNTSTFTLSVLRCTLCLEFPLSSKARRYTRILRPPRASSSHAHLAEMAKRGPKTNLGRKKKRATFRLWPPAPFSSHASKRGCRFGFEPFYTSREREPGTPNVTGRPARVRVYTSIAASALTPPLVLVTKACSPSALPPPILRSLFAQTVESFDGANLRPSVRASGCCVCGGRFRHRPRKALAAGKRHMDPLGSGPGASISAR